MTFSPSVQGTYFLRLTANDSLLSGFDEIQVNAVFTDRPPVVNAGQDQSITLPTTATLTGTATDEGLPNPPGALTSTWSKVSGTGNVVFANPNSPSTTATFSAKGYYVLRLESTDGLRSTADDVLITVKGSAVLVNGNTTTTAGDNALKARLEDMGFTTTLVKSSQADAGDANGMSVVVIAGTAVASDVGAAFKTVSVPVVVARELLFDDMKMTGATQNTHYGNTASQTQVAIMNPTHPMAAGLTGTVTSSSTTVTYFWGVPSANGVSVASIVGNSGRSTMFAYETGAVMFSGQVAPARRVGMFLSDAAASNLTADGGLLFDAAISWATATNLAPRVNAGPDAAVLLPGSLSLSGTVYDDGLPTPPLVTLTWSVTSAPPGGMVTFSNPNQAQTSATFSQAAGTYVIRLTASDGERAGFDELTVTASAANQPPFVNAGTDQMVTLPATANLLGTVSDDGLPNPPGATAVTWTKDSGPGTVTFGNANSVATTAQFSAKGVYVLRLTADDGQLSTFDTLTVTANATALLVVGSATLTPGDNAFKSRLEGLGYTTTIAIDSTANSGDWNGKTVIVIAPSILPGDVTTKFRGLAIPIVVSHDGIYDTEMGMTTGVNRGTSPNETQVAITSPTHPLAAGLSGTVNVVTQPQTFGWGIPGAAAVKAATLTSNASKATVFGYETGAAMPLTPNIAPARRVGFFAKGDAATYFTTQGSALFDAAVSWAAQNNLPPKVSAGPDQMVLLSATASLPGTAWDDGLPGPLTVAWSKQSGPGTVTFMPPNLAATTATFSAEGVYVLRLTASDGYFSVYDEAVFTVSATNQAPVVSVGIDQTITLPATATLTATAMDDGQPVPPGTMTLAWSRQHGPGSVTFGTPNGLVTTASFSEVGVYVLRLTASDGVLSGWDELTVTVKGDALLIVGSTNLTADDDVFKSHLEAAGYTVVVMDGLSAGSGNATDKRLVLIANSAIEADVNIKFRGVTVPVLVSRDPLFDEMGMTTIHGNTQVTETEVSILAPLHPLAAGLTGQPAVVWQLAPFGWGTPGAAAVKAATLTGNANRATVFAYETGAAMPGPLPNTAPARRVGFFAKGGVPSNFNPQGEALLDAAIKWAAKANLPPTVHAGPDASITLPTTDTVALAGSVGDDGLPTPPGSLTILWSKLAGPGPVAIDSPSQTNTLAHFSEVGTYVLELEASDGIVTTGDTLTVTVDSTAPGGNIAPTVNAGVDQQIWAGQTTTLQGTAADDGYPNPPGSLTAAWTKFVGPGSVTFGSPNAFSTTAEFSTVGTYGLRLSVSDSLLTATDDLIVSVLPNPKALLVTAPPPLGSGDTAIKSHLEAAGFTVTVKGDVGADAGDANGKDVVIISSTTNAGVLSPTFQSMTTAMIDCNANSYHDMGMTDGVAGVDFGVTTGTDTRLTITNPVHPIAGGLRDDVTVATSPAAFQWGANMVGTAIVANVFGSTTQSGIFAYEKGEIMPAAIAAPGRRVGFFSCDGALFTAGAWKLFDAAVAWAATRTVPVLYVKGATSGDEKTLRRHFAALGYALTVTTDAQVVAADANNQAFVYVSASASASALNTKLQGVAVPVVTAAQANYGSMGMTGNVLNTDYGFTANQTDIQILDPGHPLAAFLDETQTVATTIDGDYGWGAPAPAAMKVASIVGFSYGATIFAYEQGDQMVGLSAPARRVGLYINQNTTGIFTTEGWALFDAALRWASDADPDGDGLSTFLEYQWGTDPFDPDTNDDGILDGAEVAMGKSPTNLDMDGDGVLNATELQNGTDPFNPDTDGDGVPDALDAFPLDPTRSQAPPPVPGDTTPPVVTLTEPPNAILISSIP